MIPKSIWQTADNNKRNGKTRAYLAILKRAARAGICHLLFAEATGASLFKSLSPALGIGHILNALMCSGFLPKNPLYIVPQNTYKRGEFVWHFSKISAHGHF
ncbi:hypothetical protein [Faecalispora jeddahensis]|uniref:hypothetical protein n=1 Tax=Faecalispora jeddahensis TaxID=1414721 RepID=UPI0028B1A030|nr:hypothetical protein [Faecalispora jeddahensis]